MTGVSHNRERTVTANFWAAARAAVGGPSEEFAHEPHMSLRDLIARIIESHPESPGLAALLDCSSYLLGDRPVGREAWSSTLLGPGDVVEVLPPFAGG